MISFFILFFWDDRLPDYVPAALGFPFKFPNSFKGSLPHSILSKISGERSGRHRTIYRLVNTMKMIKAMIRPEKFEDVKAALDTAGFGAMTIFDVEEAGASRKGSSNRTRGSSMLSTDPKRQLEIVVSDDATEKVIDIIVNAARTGEESVTVGSLYFRSRIQFVSGRENGDPKGSENNNFSFFPFYKRG